MVLMWSFTCFSRISSLACGEWCSILFRWAHMSQDIFHIFLISSTTHRLLDLRLWAVCQRPSWCVCQLLASQPSKKRSHTSVSWSFKYSPASVVVSVGGFRHLFNPQIMASAISCAMLLSLNHCCSCFRLWSQVWVASSLVHCVMWALSSTSVAHCRHCVVDLNYHLAMFLPLKRILRYAWLPNVAQPWLIPCMLSPVPSSQWIATGHWKDVISVSNILLLGPHWCACKVSLTTVWQCMLFLCSRPSPCLAGDSALDRNESGLQLLLQ